MSGNILKKVRLTSNSGVQVYTAYRKDIYEKAINTCGNVGLVKFGAVASIPILTFATQNPGITIGSGFLAWCIWIDVSERYEKEIELSNLEILKSLPKEIQEINQQLQKDTGLEAVWILSDNLVDEIVVNKKD